MISLSKLGLLILTVMGLIACEHPLKCVADHIEVRHIPEHISWVAIPGGPPVGVIVLENTKRVAVCDKWVQQ